MKLCKLCGQPMKPKGVKKLPNEYDHANGCVYALKQFTTKSFVEAADKLPVVPLPHLPWETQ